MKKEVKTTFHDSGELNEVYEVNSEGMKDGYYRCYYPDGILSQRGFYKEDKRVGKWSSHRWLDSYRETCPFVNDKADGEYILYHKNGKVEKKGTWKDGNMCDIWTYYFKNGKVERECTWKDGKKDGEEIIYNRDGSISMRHTYKNGDLLK